MGWKKFKSIGAINGVQVTGDKTVPRTRIWNHLQLRFWGWKTTAVLTVDPETAEKGWHIGYIPENGSPRLLSKVLHRSDVRMRVGHEDVTFFAITLQGTEYGISKLGITSVNHHYKEAPILLERRAHIDDDRVQHVPLL